MREYGRLEVLTRILVSEYACHGRRMRIRVGAEKDLGLQRRLLVHACLRHGHQMLILVDEDLALGLQMYHSDFGAECVIISSALLHDSLRFRTKT